MLKYRSFLSLPYRWLTYLPKNCDETLLTKCTPFSFSNFSQVNNHASQSVFNSTIQEPEMEEKLGANVFPHRWIVDEVVDEVVGDDAKLKEELKRVIAQIELLELKGMAMPSKLSTEDWKELLLMKTLTQRQRFLLFRFKVEMIKKNEQENLKEKRRKRQEYLAAKANEVQVDDGKLKYGFLGSHIFLRIPESRMAQFDNSRLMKALQFSQPLVFDCSYEQFMSMQELRNCGKQLYLAFGVNRAHIEPFSLQFCNVTADSTSLKWMQKTLVTLHEDWYPFHGTEKSYLDLYPKEKLVYLTPHCNTDLLEYNHDDIYIIGAYVDKGHVQHHSSAKAKKEGIRMARLPIDRYIDWGHGHKSLNLIAMIEIMLEMRHTNDWNKAFNFLPKRFTHLTGNTVSKKRSSAHYVNAELERLLTA